jgi:[phosphatase 2A protein]-leucine-carboxy methyltransferase
MAYLEPATIQALLQWPLDNLHQAAFAFYDPVELQGSFGHVMLKNISMRGLSMPGHTTIDGLHERFKSYEKCTVQTMHEWYTTHVSTEETTRLNAIEQMDEYEEFNLLGKHYAVGVATHNLTHFF